MLRPPAPTPRTWFICAVLALSACAAPPTKDETRTSIDAAQNALSNFLKDPEMTWFQRHIGEAKAILISPRILQAGFVIGGSGGQAVVIARGKSGDGWNGPAFYRTATGSIGLQAGAQASETVALIMSEIALNSLLSTSFKLGADVSVAAGPVGAGTGSPVTADMVVFTRSKGLYGGLNLDGTVVTIDQGRNHALYGQTVTPVEILITRSVTSSYAVALAQTASPGAASAQGSSSR